MDYFHKFDALITPSLGSVKPLRRSSEGDSSQSYENCDWKEPKTLKHYYENMESADKLVEIMGENFWDALKDLREKQLIQIVIERGE